MIKIKTLFDELPIYCMTSSVADPTPKIECIIRITLHLSIKEKHILYAKFQIQNF